MVVYARSDATVETVKSLLRDLGWVGGCRDPEDPAFESLDVIAPKVSRAKHLDRS